jgi:hypothetical protein
LFEVNSDGEKGDPISREDSVFADMVGSLSENQQERIIKKAEKRFKDMSM